MLPLQFKEVTQNTVFDSAIFGRNSCSNLTSLVAYRTILVHNMQFCQEMHPNQLDLQASKRNDFK